jgi:hypothetical protein
MQCASYQIDCCIERQFRMAWRALAFSKEACYFGSHRLVSGAFGGCLHENLFGRAFEVLEEGRAQPSFHLSLWPPIPIAFVFGSSPNESGGVTWKGPCREDDFESVRGVRDVFCQHIQNVVSAADKRFPHQAGSRVIEYPYRFQPVGENDTQNVHFLTVAAPWARMQVICPSLVTADRETQKPHKGVSPSKSLDAVVQPVRPI